MSKRQQDLILDRLNELHKDLKELREKDLPQLKIDMAVMKEKTSHSAKIITGIGGLIAVTVSSAIAFFK